MNDELIAAAKRLVQFNDDYDYTHWDGNKPPFKPDEDGVTVARAMLHELDDTPVDEAWLRSVGLKVNHKGSKFYCVGLPKMAIAIQSNIIYVALNESRGQVRTLCRALGIQLKES